MAVALLTTAAVHPAGARGQDAAGGAQVAIVQTVGCAEPRGGADVSWWLTRAAEPAPSGPGPFEAPQVEAARAQATGSREFELIGFADFADAATQLAWAERAAFTTEEQVNATGDLRPGRFVLVKGLLIDPGGNPRINLLSVVGLADACD